MCVCARVCVCVFGWPNSRVVVTRRDQAMREKQQHLLHALVCADQSGGGM